MFIDICYPKKNERKFIEIAKKLNTKALCFVYREEKNVSKVDSDIQLYHALEIKNTNKLKKLKDIDFFVSSKISRNIPNKKKIVYYYSPGTKTKSFHYPIDKSHVLFKELKEKDILVGLSFNEILKCTKFPAIIEKTAFFLKLCEKYKVKVFIGSFADTPYELRSRKDLEAVLDVLKLTNKSIKKATHNLHSFLEKESESFL